jgi:hypothetical protein
MKKYLAAAAAAFYILSAAGCASGNAVIENKKAAYEAPVEKPAQYEAGAVVVRAKRLTKLEMLKVEGARKNNGQTVEIAAGTIGALAVFAGAQNFIKTGNRGYDALAQMALTGAAAYVCAIAAGAVYELFTGKK